MKKPPAFAEGFPFAVIGVPACTAVLNIHSKQQKATLAFPSLNILAGEPALWAGGGGNEPPMEAKPTTYNSCEAHIFAVSDGVASIGRHLSRSAA